MHLASSLFSLDDILQEPRLIAPPARVEPGVVGIQEDIISQTLPYIPAWPELAAIYRAPTIGVAEALEGGSNIVIVGAAGMGKTVALAHLASMAANLSIGDRSGFLFALGAAFTAWIAGHIVLFDLPRIYAGLIALAALLAVGSTLSYAF